MPEHKFNGMIKYHKPIISNITFDLPNEKYHSYIIFKDEKTEKINSEEICSWIQDMCKGSTIFSRCQGLFNKKGTGAVFRIVLYFENTKDIVLFRLSFPEVVDLIIIHGKISNVKDKSITLNLDELRKREDTKKGINT